MAHSFIQAFDSEIDAFRAFARNYPATTLLVDTYDTLEGVRRVVTLAKELRPDFRVRAVRLDSGDLAELAFRTRAILDEAGLQRVEIFASGGLDEYQIARLVTKGAPIDGFGVGTRMGVSSDVPALDMAYKLVSYRGRDRLKLSPGKRLLPGRKQVFRIEEDGRAARDIIARHDESHAGTPLLHQVMRAGQRLPAGVVDLEGARAWSRRMTESFPGSVRGLEPADPPYPVAVSDELRANLRELSCHPGNGPAYRSAPVGDAPLHTR
jgi:nicotinate phosphoribosyltransferase